MSSCWYTLGIGAILSLAVMGCTAQDEIEDIEEAQQAQIMPSNAHDWRMFKFTFTNNTVLMQVLVMGGTAVGDFKANKEYWYVMEAGLPYLGLRDLAVVQTDGDGTPSSLSGDQEFMMPVYPGWSSFSSDPVSGGYLYDAGTQHLRLAADSGGLTRVTWYQTIASTATAANINPEATLYAGSGSVTVPTPQVGYYIDATP